MIRKIIHIDKEKCNGCGLCATACHEGAIGIMDGKAQLLRDDYCDGLGDCLPACPTGAISFIEREALEYDETAVKANMKKRNNIKTDPVACDCPGSQSKTIKRKPASANIQTIDMPSQLQQWPIQIKLAPVNAPYFHNASLLIAADCSAFAYANFHEKFIKNKITLIGCPKLDEEDYSDKLTAILKENNIKNITVIRMGVPCCGGLEHAVINALKSSGKMLPWQVITISTSGQILE